MVFVVAYHIKFIAANKVLEKLLSSNRILP